MPSRYRMSVVQVEPKDFVQTQTCTSVSVRVVDVELNVSASLNITLLDANNNIIKMDRITVSGADYTAWGTDDNYIVNYVLALYGLTQKA